MINTNQRATFATLADVLIPASDTMPSATAAGVADALLDQALGYRPDLVGPFTAALAACAGKDAENALDDLSKEDPGQFEALTVVASGE